MAAAAAFGVRMMKNKFRISSLILSLCLCASILTSCGGNKDTTHDAGSDGQVTTEEKNEKPSGKPSLPQSEDNENGVVGEIVTDATEGARNIVGGVAEGARGIVGGGANGNGSNGGGMNGNDGGSGSGSMGIGGTSGDNGMNGGGMNGSASTREFPRKGK